MGFSCLRTCAGCPFPFSTEPDFSFHREAKQAGKSRTIMGGVLKPEMAHDMIESPIFLWSTRIIDTVSTIIILFILGFHVITVFQSKPKYNPSIQRRSTISTLNMFTISYITSQFILLLILSLNIWEILLTNSDCNIIVIIIVTLYHLSKSLFYGISITRLHVAFNLSPLEYSTFTMTSLCVFTCVFTIFVCCGTPFIIFGVWLTELCSLVSYPYKRNTIKLCCDWNMDINGCHNQYRSLLFIHRSN